MPTPKFPELEEKMLAKWDEEKLFEKTLEKTAGGEQFVFFEGPPTANAKPGLHHIIARAFKDAIPRYQTMCGRCVDRKAGWDTHGLPVELQVEKALGISGKQQIENIVVGDKRASIIEFNRLCREMVWTNLQDWEKMTRRIGYWLDFKNAYVTYKNEYIQSLWSILKKIHERGLLYQGYKVVPHCPRCGTALSSHEVAQGYKSIKENSVYVKFKVVGELNTFLLGWTTTPWTLPGNVALAVGPGIQYVKARDKKTGEIYIAAAGLLKNFVSDECEIVETVKGESLVGIRYEPLFPYLNEQLDESRRLVAFQVYSGDFVTTTDGTGIVHTAVMYGEDDYDLGIRVGLPSVHTVAEDGTFLPFVLPWAGKFVKATEVEQEIISALQMSGALLKIASYEHDYPFCWRCGTPLLYYAKDSWFIRMSALQSELMHRNEMIHWVPSHIRDGRFGEWLRNVKDWAISRERYWGTPLPIWKCDACGEFEVIGSLEELRRRAGAAPNDLHRPFVDDPSWSCDACSDSGRAGIRRRVNEVMDVWFDSGAMFAAQWGYIWGEENAARENFIKHFPADYISEAIDQTRGWFYTLLAVATALDARDSTGAPTAPFRNVICLGHILDSRGLKMSKSKGNIVDPWEIFNIYGSDALRWHLYSMSQAGEPKLFDKRGVEEVVKKVFLILWNVLEFYKLYIKGAGTSGTATSAGRKAVAVVVDDATASLDVWLVNRQQQLINIITEKLDSYELTDATRAIADFVTELSTWYVRRSRDRIKAGGNDGIAAVGALKTALLTTAKLMAPFAPLVADAMYREIVGDKTSDGSVHLQSWPAIRQYDAKILSDMTALRALVSQALEQRATAGIPVRQALGDIIISKSYVGLEYLFDILKEELNVESVVFGDEIKLNTKVTPELKEKGLAREIIRNINAARKDVGLKPGQKSRFIVYGPEEIISVAEKFRFEIERATMCELNLKEGDKLSVQNL